MQKKIKVNIIGAGVSGLCAGSYLQMNGFDTEIFEKHSIPGGLCTSWKKGEYTIDGCAHWILGSAPGSSFYKMWSELLHMESIPFYNHEVRMHVQVKNTRDKYGSNTFHLYTDLNRLQQYITDLSPEDGKVIKKLIRHIRVLQQFDLPPVLDDLPLVPSIIRGIKMARYFRFLALVLKLNKVTNYTLARQFKNPFLRESFELLFDGEEVKMLVLAFPMASFDQKSAGYPIGGSLSWAQRLADRYIELGGKIHYNTPVKKIITENDEAKGLLVRNNVTHYGDLVLSSADWHHTVFDFLEGRYVDKGIMALKEKKSLELFYSVLLVSFGVNKSFEGHGHFSRFPISETLSSPCGKSWDRLEVHIYNYDPTLAPKGKTVIACSFYTKNGTYWIDLRKNDRAKYREEKTKFCKAVLDRLEERLPGIREHVEVMDFATPATVLRYTNNWQGSAQGWLPSEDLTKGSPVGFKLPGLKNFYYSSHWNRPGGGLPIAINTGRDVARAICRQYKVKFNQGAVKPGAKQA